MRDTNLLTEIKRIIRDCEDYKGKGESRYSEEQQELLAYSKIKELCGDGKGERNGCM